MNEAETRDVVGESDTFVIGLERIRDAAGKAKTGKPTSRKTEGSENDGLVPAVGMPPRDLRLQRAQARIDLPVRRSDSLFRQPHVDVVVDCRPDQVGS